MRITEENLQRLREKEPVVLDSGINDEDGIYTDDTYIAVSIKTTGNLNVVLLDLVHTNGTSGINSVNMDYVLFYCAHRQADIRKQMKELGRM